jgi:hypothetical protein
MVEFEIMSTSEKYQYDFCVYGMPVRKIEYNIYGGLFGNATRAVGLANNLAHKGFRTVLIVEDNFICDNSPFLSKNLSFIKKKRTGKNKFCWLNIFLLFAPIYQVLVIFLVKIH